MKAFGFILSALVFTAFFELFYLFLDLLNVSIPEIMYAPLGILTTFMFVLSSLVVLEFQEK